MTRYNWDLYVTLPHNKGSGTMSRGGREIVRARGWSKSSLRYNWSVALYELIESLTAWPRPTTDQANLPSIMKKGGVYDISAITMELQTISRIGDSVFLSCVVPGQLAVLHWMTTPPHRSIWTKWSDGLLIFKKGHKIGKICGSGFVWS